MRNQKGFTLIELIIVIVVLGILAVTAAPQFINFSSDARASALKGMEGSIKGAMQLTYSKAAIDGVEEEETDTITVKGSDVDIAFGYPQATDAGLLSVIEGSFNTDLTADWIYITDGTADPAEIFIAQSSSFSTAPADLTAFQASNCYIQFAEAADEDTAPVITVTDTDC